MNWLSNIPHIKLLFFDPWSRPGEAAETAEMEAAEAVE